MTYDFNAQRKVVDADYPLRETDLDARQLPDGPALDRPVGRRMFRTPKQSVTIRLDADVVAWFKALAVDRGYQTAINRALREYIEQHS